MNLVCIGGGGLTAVLSALYFSPQLARILQKRHLKRHSALNRTLSLTYDDGPGSSLTPKVLDLLAKHQAKATFFLLGSRSLKNPEVISRIVLEGHEVGCHSQSHLHAWKNWPWKVMQDVDRGYETLSRWL